MITEIRQKLLQYLEIEKENIKLIREAWNICHKSGSWSGGSYLDAMKMAGNKSFYDVGFESQNQILWELGISREYDIEGHDMTARVLEICDKILEVQSSTPKARNEK